MKRRWLGHSVFKTAGWPGALSFVHCTGGTLPPRCAPDDDHQSKVRDSDPWSRASDGRSKRTDDRSAEESLATARRSRCPQIGVGWCDAWRSLYDLWLFLSRSSDIVACLCVPVSSVLDQHESPPCSDAVAEFVDRPSCRRDTHQSVDTRASTLCPARTRTKRSDGPSDKSGSSDPVHHRLTDSDKRTPSRVSSGIWSSVSA